MQLKPNIGSDRAWVWHVLADFADEVPKQELLAIRFANSESESESVNLCIECVECVDVSSDAILPVCPLMHHFCDCTHESTYT